MLKRITPFALLALTAIGFLHDTAHAAPHDPVPYTFAALATHLEVALAAPDLAPVDTPEHAAVDVLPTSADAELAVVILGASQPGSSEALSPTPQVADGTGLQSCSASGTKGGDLRCTAGPLALSSRQPRLIEPRVRDLVKQRARQHRSSPLTFASFQLRVRHMLAPAHC